MNIVLWVVQVVVALGFATSGFVKVTQPISSLKNQMAWVVEVPAGLVRFIGAAELLGAVGLILPAATGLGSGLTIAAAVGLALIMVLALGFHLQRGEYNRLSPSAVLLLLSLVVVIGRLAVVPFSA